MSDNLKELENRIQMLCDMHVKVVKWLAFVTLYAVVVTVLLMGMSIACFAQEYEVTIDFEGMTGYEESVRLDEMGTVELYPNASDPPVDRVIIYDEMRQNPKEYIIRNQGDGTSVMEPAR